MQMGVAMAFSQHTAPEFIRDAVQLVEAKGFDAIWVPEHVLFFPDYASTYPYSDTGRIPGDPVGLLDPFTALAFIASHTKRVRLATGICLVPQRQPVYTAKMVADIDFLSNGRMDFGVGVGWLKEEFDNLGAELFPPGCAVRGVHQRDQSAVGGRCHGIRRSDGVAHRLPLQSETRAEAASAHLLRRREQRSTAPGRLSGRWLVRL